MLIFILFFFFSAAASASDSLIDKVEFSGLYKTDALILYKEGNIIHEEYRYGYDGDKVHRLWSVSKSFTSLLIGIAIKERRLSLHDKICDLIGEQKSVNNKHFCSMTVDDLLHWQSGIDWRENYFSFQFKNSTVLRALYGSGIHNFGEFFLSLPFTHEPGKKFTYSTGDSHFLSYLLKQVYPAEEYDNLPWSKLFTPLGINSATLERDQTGTYMFGSYLYMKIHDILKLAKFVLREYKSSQILPENWMKESTQVRENVSFNWWDERFGKAPGIPARHWWVNRPSTPNQMIPWPDAPADTFVAFGVFGQIVAIIPSQDAIIIRMAHDAIGSYDRSYFMKVMMHALKVAP